MTLLARVAPPIVFGGRRAGLLIERNLLVYRRGWLVIVSGFFEPLFYLLSIARSPTRLSWRRRYSPARR
jgi:lipooligosaccharide transport system permease protein